MKSPQYVALGAKFVLSTVDVSVPAGNAKAVSWSVFKSPALALVGPDGSLVRSVTDLKNWDDVKQATAGN